jgi:ABC-type transport system involved in cytochrome bd biosynthesis fused ATPase/permease subunit
MPLVLVIIITFITTTIMIINMITGIIVVMIMITIMVVVSQQWRSSGYFCEAKRASQYSIDDEMRTWMMDYLFV